MAFIGVNYRCDTAIGPATHCDEMGCFPTILRVLEASQTIAGISLKIAAVWPVSFNDGLFSYCPAMLIAAMVIRNI